MPLRCQGCRYVQPRPVSGYARDCPKCGARYSSEDFGRADASDRDAQRRPSAEISTRPPPAYPPPVSRARGPGGGAHTIFCILHFSAAMFLGFWLLLITIPAHLIYSAIVARNP